MNKVGGGGLLVAGIFLIILGLIVQSSIVEWLLDVIGIVIIVSGAALGIWGIVKMLSGGGTSGASDY